MSILIDELTLDLASKLDIQLNDLTKALLTSGSAGFSVEEQLALARQNEEQFRKQMSAYDAELFIDQDVSQFGQVFGADAVIFSEILTWKKVGVGIETDLKYTIKSTHTNEVVFERTCNFFLDLSVKSSGGGFVGALVAATATLINTAVTDNIVAARKCNSYVFQDLPRGKYDPLYQKDKEENALDKDLNLSF